MSEVVNDGTDIKESGTAALVGGQAALDHAWRYFELHANQRFAVFNFYTVFVGLLTAGLGVALQGSQRFAMLGVVLGLMIILLSFVFWKLDQRGAMLIKHSEGILEKLELHTVGLDFAVFANEPAAYHLATRGRGLGRLWTFGRSLRLIFIVIGFIGFGGTVLSGLRAAGMLTWNAAGKPAEIVATKVKSEVDPKVVVKVIAKPPNPELAPANPK
jgi:hypothetical protein